MEQLLPYVESEPVTETEAKWIRKALLVRRKFKKLDKKYRLQTKEKIYWKETYDKLFSRLRKELRFRMQCRHTYWDRTELGKTRKNPIIRCDVDKELCKFQCGIFNIESK